MVRENRVKEYIFPEFTVNGSNYSVTSNYSINGEVLDLTFTNKGTIGSFYFKESGTNFTFFTEQVTSGTDSSRDVPAILAKDELGGALGSLTAFRDHINSEITMTVSGMTSGPGTTFGPIYLRYI